MLASWIFGQTAAYDPKPDECMAEIHLVGERVGPSKCFPILRLIQKQSLALPKVWGHMGFNPVYMETMLMRQNDMGANIMALAIN